MSSAQEIVVSRARLFLPLDSQYDVAGVRSTRNLGMATGAPANATVGNGTVSSTFPTQMANSRGVRLDGGDYMRVPLDFTYNEPFTLAILTNSILPAASWLFSTYDSSTARGIRFGSTGSGALVCGIYDDGGRSITLTSANSYLPTDKQIRLYCFSYNGGLSPGSLAMSIDDLVVPAVGAGTALASSISSGRNLLIGARWNAATPTEILAACNIYCVASYPTVLDSYDKRLLKARMMQERHVR
jgi:hypothetical protein